MEANKKVECPIPDSPSMRTVGLLYRTMRRHHALVERRISDLDIHQSQHRMLMTLARRQENIPSQRELAELLGISAAAVATTLKKLDREGYISRSMTHEDNRKNQIRITEKGLSKVMEGLNVFESSDRVLFQGFSPEELNTLLSLLQRVDRNLDAAGVPSDPPPPHHDHKHPHPPRPRKEV